MFCPACGTKNPDDARFCASCGKPLPQGGVPIVLSTGQCCFRD
ncbi:zinc-ribbon domain-containing protein [Collinsella aerofaciens]|uniref:Zinc-ribbon domain-containing protein n=1 Tax=Collinsella aerofaciens (strain ATCC 25986 / DSM 3979 / JCM 10188 / KCTC 3647 / NCTC 11838 / VPI 1003) TaxID=411903 RepID=A0A858B2Z2_COLAA|nr:zinc-ribbon domain-containing protein [Collinsella aerofaciens ATCC 25986]